MVTYLYQEIREMFLKYELVTFQFEYVQNGLRLKTP